MSKRILIFNSTEYILDEASTRLERSNMIYTIAQKSGIEITFITSKFNHFTKKYRIINNPNIITLWTIPYYKNISIWRFINHLILGLNLMLLLFKKRHDYDVIYVSFPPIETAFASVIISKLLGKESIVDFRDRWPELITENTQSKLIKLLVKFYKYPRNYAVRNCTKLISTSPEFLRNICEVSGIHNSEQPLLEAVNMSYRKPGFVKEKRITGNIELIFSGSFVLQEGSALRDFLRIFLSTERRDISLKLCGDGPMRPTLEDMAKDDPRVVFTGFLTESDLHAALSEAHFGVLPYKPVSHFEFSYPNKLGEYLAFGLPIITSLNKGAVANLVEEKKFGFTYDYQNSYQLRDILDNLSIDHVTALEKVCHGTFKESFNADTVYKKFVDENFK